MQELLKRLIDGDSSQPERWIAFGAAVVLSLIVAVIVSFIIDRILKRMAKKTESTVDDRLIAVLRAPLVIGLTVTGIYAGTLLLHLPAKAALLCRQAYTVVLVLLIVGLLLRAVRVAGNSIQLAAKNSGNTYNTLLINLLTPLLKAIIWMIGLLFLLEHVFGINISALLAGAGIVAMAVAFAAQNTIADIFGAVALIADKPFQIGQRIQVGDKDGVVEAIGLRSTRMRSLDGTLWCVPNRTMTDTAILNFSNRPNFKHIFTIGLTYSTTPEELRHAKEILHAIIERHPLIDMAKQPPIITFAEMASYSLNLQAICWFQTTDFLAFTKAKEEINFQIYEELGKAGLSFAFPSQSLYIEKMPGK